MLDSRVAPHNSRRPRILFEDFQKPTYEGWTVVGQAFGPGPIEKAKMPSYQGDVGGPGKRVACSFNARNGETVEQGDNYKGKLTSREFDISRRYIGFYIGGGNHPCKTCINLLVDGKVVRTETGKDREELMPAAWEVSEFEGKRGIIEIVDDREGGWGHITVDEIVFTDRDPAWTSLGERPDHGTMSLALLGSAEQVRYIPGYVVDRPRLESPQTYSDPSAAWKPLFGSQPESGGWSLSL